MAQANSRLDEHFRFVEDRVEVRKEEDYPVVPVEQVDYMDVSAEAGRQRRRYADPLPGARRRQPRALMGSNMQRQAVPAPAPGLADRRHGDGISGRARLRPGGSWPARSGTVLSSTGQKIILQEESGAIREYPLQKFRRSNQDTCINQRPIVRKGDHVEELQVIADSSSTDKGELGARAERPRRLHALRGRELRGTRSSSVSGLVRDDVFTSIHIEKYETEGARHQAGAGRDHPRHPERRRGQPLRPGRGWRDPHRRGGPPRTTSSSARSRRAARPELSAEERLLRAIFGEKAREVKDTSLRVPHGVHGKVIDVKQFRREDTELPGRRQSDGTRVAIAQKRKISEGDKMAGRHGNKGVISRILPAEDMPYLPDGTPVDIILNPLGVPSRMNIGQLLENDARAGRRRGRTSRSPRRSSTGATEEQIKGELDEVGLHSARRQDLPLRRAHRRAVRPPDGRGHHLHAQTRPLGRGQDPRPVHRPILAGHAAAARREGAVRRTALRGDGSVGARSVWRGQYVARDAHRQVGRCGRARSRPTNRSSRARKSSRRACRNRSRCWSRNCARSASRSRVINEDEETVNFSEDTSGDLLSKLDRINLSGFERTEA